MLQGDYWSFNLAGAYLPLVLLEFNVSTGANSVTETYRQYIYIYLPGILGAIMAFFSVQLPLVGRKWSLVFSACMQGLSMALYTQVRSATGYVGLNALEYIMQTVSDLTSLVTYLSRKDLELISSTSMPSCTPPPLSYSTRRIEELLAVCYRV